MILRRRRRKKTLNREYNRRSQNYGNEKLSATKLVYGLESGSSLNIALIRKIRELNQVEKRLMNWNTVIRLNVNLVTAISSFNDVVRVGKKARLKPHRKRDTLDKRMRIPYLLLIYAALSALYLLITVSGPVDAIGCFVCSSFSGSNPACEDIFNSTVQRTGVRGSVSIYQYPCWSSKKQRKGLFPADHCVKVSGYRTDNPTMTMVIRTCALDSGTLTADTEIVRVSHCGYFKYDGNQYTGCVQACDTDGCNAAITYAQNNVGDARIAIAIAVTLFTTHFHTIFRC